MNIYWREIRANLAALLAWCAGMVFMVGAGMGKFAGMASAGQSINDFMSSLPAAVQALFGSDRLDLSKASGFYGVLYLYLLMMAAIHASLLGANILAKEERDRTSEFLFVKPVSRDKVIAVKLLAAFTNVVVLNVVTYGASTALLATFGQGEDVSQYLQTLMGGMFCLQLIFLAWGSASAGLVKKPAAAAGLASAAMLATFVLSVFIDFDERLAFLKYATPFKYFDAGQLLPPNGSLEPVYVILSAGLTLIFVVMAFLLYRRKDLAI